MLYTLLSDLTFRAWKTSPWPKRWDARYIRIEPRWEVIRLELNLPLNSRSFVHFHAICSLPPGLESYRYIFFLLRILYIGNRFFMCLIELLHCIFACVCVCMFCSNSNCPILQIGIHERFSSGIGRMMLQLLIRKVTASPTAFIQLTISKLVESTYLLPVNKMGRRRI